MIAHEHTVYVVDDDLAVRNSLSALIRSAGLEVVAYASAEDFLEEYDGLRGRAGCVVLDAFMPGMSGPDLAKILARDPVAFPVIMISDHADVSLAVESMRAGAVSFLEKPVHGQELLKLVREAVEQHVCHLREKVRCTDIAERLETLSPRERQVMDLLVAGEYTKRIAKKLGIGPQTVARHRLRILEKMEVESVAQLVCLVVGFRRTPSRVQRSPD